MTDKSTLTVIELNYDYEVYRLRESYPHSQDLRLTFYEAAHAIEQERDALRISSAKLDKDVGELIDERDRAEDAISQAYFLITGRPAEWSNLWGYDEALEEIDAGQTLLRKERDALKAALLDVLPLAEEFVEAMGCDHDVNICSCAGRISVVKARALIGGRIFDEIYD